MKVTLLCLDLQILKFATTIVVLYFFLSTNKIIFLIDNFYFSTFITFYEYMVLYGVRDRHLVIYMYYLFFYIYRLL